jgi:hypothetical protein
MCVVVIGERLLSEIAALSILLLSRGAIPEIHGNRFVRLCEMIAQQRNPYER